MINMKVISRIYKQLSRKGKFKMEKLYWGPTDVAAYANISKSKAYQFIQVMKDEYELDERRLLKGKVPVVIVKDFFDFKVEKKV